MRISARRIAAAALGLGAGLAAAQALAAPACGMNTGKPAEGEPIPIGAIATASGGGDLSAGSKGAAAYFACVNANGGINGRPVKFIMEDDQLQPPKNLELAKKLVEDDGVVAFVGSSSLVDCITNAQYFADRNVISLMAAGVAVQCFNASHVAPLNQGPRLGVIAEATFALEKLGSRNMVFAASNWPGFDWVSNGVRGWAEEHGVKYTEVQYDGVSIDNDTLVTQVLQTGADTVLTVAVPPTIIPFLDAAQGQGAGDKLKVLAPTPVYNPDVPKAVGSYWDDKFWVALEFGPTDGRGADAKNYTEVMAAYYDGDDANSLTEGGYLAAKMATEAMLKLDPAKIDRDSVTAALQGVENFSSDLLCNPWSFGPKDAAGRSPNKGARVAVMKDGAWHVGECFEVNDSGKQ